MSSGRSSSTKSEDRNTTRIREIQNGCIDNKRCFDCRQRGPNYVNVTVGSFVCTKCSGMLRGVTPPHRIKSISMSTFTNEDVSLLDSRGNLWCQKVWLATYSGSMAEDFTASGDETLKPHILDKYEKKRYYIDPTTQKDLDLFSSSHLRQSSKTTPSVSSTSTHLIGSRISQKYAGSPSTSKLQQALLNGISSSSLSFNTPTQTTPNITTTPTSRTSEIKVLQNVDPFGSSFISSSKGPTTNNNNINNTSASNFEAFANFETATFEPPPADPLRLFRSTTPEPLVQTASSSSTISNQQNITSNNVTNTNNTGSSLQTFPPPSHNHSSNHNYTASSTSRTSSVVSPTMNSNTSTTSEDRYAALKDLDEIFRSVHVSETNDTSGGATNIFTNSSPAVNGASSIFGSVNNDNTTVSGGTDKIVSSIFETSSSMSKTNNDSWKRLSTNSSDNQGWATFGSTTTPSSSSSSSTNTASNPFNLGPTNFSQLNTSPWPTTGTSPVQSGNALSNLNSSGGVGSTSTNGFSDPFSVTNHSFQNSSVSNLNHIAGTFFNSNVINNTSSSSTTCNPWDSPKAFTDNMKPSFNPKNPFL
uniref:Arf-GAP domain-containing protein n=1 Tax=Lepeophtheirus salmonis TaxID=72036 RepID=A0A0K2UYF4_LEPSM